MSDRGDIEKLISHVDGKPAAMVRLARLLLERGDHRRSYELYSRALILSPNDGEVWALARSTFSHIVPDWHFWILNDVARNQIHKSVLSRVITPGIHVLEIGTGTALFAMMAAQAGATEVITCEANPTVAAVASDVVLHNGLHNQVRVIGKQSTEMVVGTDLSRPADLLLLGNVSNNLVGDGVLQAVEHAVRHLLRPGAQIIPNAGTIRVALAEDRGTERRHIPMIDGLDFLPFNRLGTYPYQIKASPDRLSLRSAPDDLFRFDFQSGGPFPGLKGSITQVSNGGRVNGVAQWVQLDMDGIDTYENFPTINSKSAWATLFYPFKVAVETEPGEKITVCGAHDRTSLYLWS